MAEHYHFVTGRLAEHALRRILEKLAPEVGFAWSIDVLPITVAALMSTRWVARHLRVDAAATCVILPGFCQGELNELEELCGRPVRRGPRDLRSLPEYFGRGAAARENYGQHDIEIIAEINHAPRLSRQQVLDLAARLRADGADVIDVGCEPGEPWSGVADCVRALRDAGHRVSIDSLQPAEIEPAVRAGAELVLSVCQRNREAARDWGVPVVVIPDDFTNLGSLEETASYLEQHRIPYRLDPVIEPIGCGFANSLGRYLEVRRRFPQAEMMMGIGNLTELTDADSAPINVLLLGFCQEVGIRSVLTTQVINWARTSVRECDLARRMVHYAIQEKIPPKHLEPNLVLLRDDRLDAYGSDQLDELARGIRDENYRLFAENEQLHLVSRGLHLADEDPFRLFDQLLQTQPKNVDVTHAFYLGFELAKASIAITLGKQYTQDRALNWGLLTKEENLHRLKS
jgi:dihydropteroate synthase-like protein